MRDRGIGIPAAEREAIFSKFQRGEQARTRGIKGTGIGLAMVDRNRPRAPRPRRSRERARQGQHVHDRAAGERLTMARILVVEDEPDIALGLQLDLRDEGHDVEVVGDGEGPAARAREPAGT